MKTFRDLKIGDFFYYSDGGKKIEKCKILNIKDNSIYRRYLVECDDELFNEREYVVPLDYVNTSYCHNYGIYIDPKYILEKINNEYENSTLASL